MRPRRSVSAWTCRRSGKHQKGRAGVIASDIADNIPEAYKNLHDLKIWRKIIVKALN